MLKQFKGKKDTGRVSNYNNKKKEQKPIIPEKKENVDSSDSDVSVSDSSDDEYEELLIGDIIKKPNDKKEVKSDAKQEANHANHFTDVSEVQKGISEQQKQQEPADILPPLPLERQETKPIDIPKPKKKSRKTVVIKKYYQQKPKTEVAQPAVQKKHSEKPEVKLNYLGLPVTGGYDTDATRKHITNRIFNW